MIKPTWNWMKRKTTENGGFTGKKQMVTAWTKCQGEMPQEVIQAWIERTMDYVQQVIRLEGDNEYKEGRKKGQEKLLVY